MTYYSANAVLHCPFSTPFFIQPHSSAHFMPSSLKERSGGLSSRLRQLTYVAVQ
jgi:hypothetical protein